MDTTHLHLALTHFPIVGTIVGIGVLIYGFISKNNTVKNVALGTFALMALLTIPVFLTGEGAEETVEHLPGVSENIIEEHQELAELAIWVMGFLGLIALVGLYSSIKKMPFSRTLMPIILIVSLGTFGLFAKVGNLGGQIRHTEIRANAGNTQSEIGNDNESHERGHDDDDDDD